MYQLIPLILARSLSISLSRLSLFTLFACIALQLPAQEICEYKGHEFDYDAATQTRGEKFAFLIEAPKEVGLTQSNWYSWDSLATFTVSADGQTAILIGTIVNIDKNAFGNFFPGNPDIQFDAYVKFDLKYGNALNYLKDKGVDVNDPDAVSAALDTYIKSPFQYKNEVIANLEAMELWDIDPSQSTLTSIGPACTGDVITLSRRVDGGAANLLGQVGVYANDKDPDYGLGVWIATTGSFCGQELRTSPHPFTGDINIDLILKECIDPCVPPEITEFKAKKKEEKMKLKWKISDPSYNPELIFERSKDGKIFEIIGKGSEMPTIKYSHGFYFTYDKNPSSKYKYYRIRYMCPDGETTYSEVVRPIYPPTKPCMDLYPNPQVCGKPVHLKLTNWGKNKYLRVCIVSMRGRRLGYMRVRTDSNGNLRTKLPINFRPGLYQVSVQSRRMRQCQMLLIRPR